MQGVYNYMCSRHMWWNTYNQYHKNHNITMNFTWKNCRPGWNDTKKTVLLIHGFNAWPTKWYMAELRDAFLSAEVTFLQELASDKLTKI